MPLVDDTASVGVDVSERESRREWTVDTASVGVDVSERDWE